MNSFLTKKVCFRIFFFFKYLIKNQPTFFPFILFILFIFENTKMNYRNSSLCEEQSSEGRFRLNYYIKSKWRFPSQSTFKLAIYSAQVAPQGFQSYIFVIKAKPINSSTQRCALIFEEGRNIKLIRTFEENNLHSSCEVAGTRVVHTFFFTIRKMPGGIQDLMIEGFYV